MKAWLVDGVDKGSRPARKPSRASSGKASPTNGKRRTTAKDSRGRRSSEWLPSRKLGAKRTKKSIEEPGSNGRGANGAPTTSKAARPWQGRSLADRRRNKELAKRVEELEVELQSVRKKAGAEIRRLRAEVDEGSNDRSAPRSKPKLTPTGRLDVNTATFEDLRELGLSVSQTARVLSSRERSGGFRAKADLREIPELSKATRELIETRLTVRR